MTDHNLLEIRELEREEEFLRLAEIQLEVWGFDPVDVAAPHLIMLHQKLGGVVLGAFEKSGKIVAFTFSLFGLMDDAPIQWSHMLAVLPEYRGLGLGKRLKWKQRELILKRGIEICRWTFDPLETINARLNIYTLGCAVNEYLFNVYGESSGPLHSGLPTDRFVAHWALRSKRVESHAAGRPMRAPVEPGSLPLIYKPEKSGGLSAPGEPDLGRRDEFIGVPVIPGIQEIKSSHPEIAMSWRRVTGEAFPHYFHLGYSLVDVLSPEESRRPLFIYILQRGKDEG